MTAPKPPARIYVPPRSTMTSGRGNAKGWVLEFEPGERQQADPLMGWVGSGDMENQVRRGCCAPNPMPITSGLAGPTTGRTDPGRANTGAGTAGSRP